MLDQVADREDLEALVLLHQDAEIVDPRLLREDPGGAQRPGGRASSAAPARSGVRSIAWWEGSVDLGVVHPPLQGVRRRRGPGADLGSRTTCPPTPGSARSTCSTASCMAMSPWAVQNLRFDETLGQALHGYDFDICMQARAAGKKVVTADFQVDPPSLARLDQRGRGLDRGAHAARREVGGA